MKLFIEDTEVDINKFMNTLMGNYYELIKKEATKLLKKQLSQKAIDIADTLNDLQNKLECLEDDISWDEKLLKE
jgi:flagellar hook-associated protein FlgK